MDCSVEACNQQELIDAPILDNLLTQAMKDNNDDVNNGESVPVECDTLTPISGEYIERFIAEDKEQRLMNTHELLTPATQEEGVFSTTVTSTPPLGENSDHLEQNGGQ